MNDMNIDFSQMNNMNSNNGLFVPSLINQQQPQYCNNSDMIKNNNEKKEFKVDPFNNLLDLIK